MPIPEPFWHGASKPPLTDAMIAEAEQQLGVQLPAEYLALLRIQNGGDTVGLAYPTQDTSWAKDHVPLRDLAGIQTGDWQDILDSPDLSKEWGLPPRQVLLSGDGHWWITLDYRDAAHPPVVWIDVEVATETADVVQIAPSFAAFVNGLVPADVFDTSDDEVD